MQLLAESGILLRVAYLELPARKAVLVDGRLLEGYGLKDGVYLLTPDLHLYESAYKRCVADYFKQGLPMPYADAADDHLISKNVDGPVRKTS
jgi:hypothetical protein